MSAAQLSQLMPFVILVVLFYVMLILPQQRRNKAQRELMASLVVGDRVLTFSGIYGTITALSDEIVGLEIATGTVVEIARAAIARKVTE